MLLRRGLDEDEFKRLTIEEYRTQYAVPLEEATELAEVEWQIRQEVESMKKLPTAKLKTYNPDPGFGLHGVWLGKEKPNANPQRKRAPAKPLPRISETPRDQIVKSRRGLRIVYSGPDGVTKRAYIDGVISRSLRHKPTLTRREVEHIFCDDLEFMAGVRAMGFPNREGGVYKTWRVFDWIDRFSQNSRSKK